MSLLSPEVRRLTWWRPLSQSDRRALLVLVGVPFVVFGLPALLGSPAIVADNILQNFPLRVLVGQQLRTGHLPLFNPLTNSGGPLLAGMNAGAFFPLTLLFVFLPPIVAWVLNLAIVYALAGVGLFALCRRHGLTSSSSLVGALVFAWGGPMVGQIVHLAVIQGYALLPWLVLALQSLAGAWREEATRSVRDRLWSFVPGVLGVATLWGLSFLSGEPRTIAEVELLTLIVMTAMIVLPGPERPDRWRDRVGYLLSVGGAMVWGAGIAAVQLLPAWNYIGLTQRHAISYWFFGSGSLPVRWSAMWFLQNIVGGAGSFGQPRFFARYNLPEVTIYTSTAALVAVAAFLVRRTRSGWHDDDRPYVLYVAVAVVGLLATWGSFTPLGHLFYQLPLFGNTRLQSRSAVLVALAACVLLARWLDALRRDEVARGWRRAVTLAPAVVTALLAAAVTLAGEPMARFFGAMDNAPRGSGLWPSALAQCVLAVALIVVVTRGGGRRRRWVTTVVALDMALMLAVNATGFVPPLTEVEPSAAVTTALLGTHGRTALVDSTGSSTNTFLTLGGANLNVFTGLPSVQGYGSLIDNRYNNVTSTHTLFSLNACAVARGVFTPLRLGTLALGQGILIVPSSVEHQRAVWCTPATRTQYAVRYFGRPLRVRTVEALSPKHVSVANGPVNVQLLNEAGQPLGPEVVGQVATSDPLRKRVFTFPSTRSAWGVVYRAAAGVTIASAFVTNETTGVRYLLDTQFQQAIDNGQWRPHGHVGTVAVFGARSVRPSSWITSPAWGHVTSRREASWGDAWVAVTATHPVDLERSVVALPGWRATAVNDNTGVVVALPVSRHGLIQSVLVPKGRWTIHFHYHAPYIVAGLLSSVLCTVLLLVVWVADLTKRRRINR